MDQITILRKLTGEQWVNQALQLSDFVRELVEMGRKVRLKQDINIKLKKSKVRDIVII